MGGRGGAGGGRRMAGGGTRELDGTESIMVNALEGAGEDVEITQDGFSIRASSEANARTRMNSALRDEGDGYGWRVSPSQGYFGAYELRRTFRGRQTGGSRGGFDMRTSGNRVNIITGRGPGYMGID